MDHQDIQIKFTTNFREFLFVSLISETQTKFFLLPIFMLVFLVIAYRSSGDPVYFFGIIFVVLIPIFVFFKIKMIWNKNKLLREEFTYTFSKKMLRMETVQSNVELQWSFFKTVSEHKDYFFISPTKGVVYFVPKKSIIDSQVFALRELFRETFGNKAKLLV